MKRTIFFIIAVWVAVGLAFGQSIVVQSPKKGDVWKKGQEYTIAWTKAGCDNPDVKINIFKNSIDQANFVLQLTGPNTGSMKWKMPTVTSEHARNAGSANRSLANIRNHGNSLRGDIASPCRSRNPAAVQPLFEFHDIDPDD